MRSWSGNVKKNICYAEVGLSQFLLSQTIKKVFELLTGDFQLLNHDFQVFCKLALNVLWIEFSQHHVEVLLREFVSIFYNCPHVV